MYTQTFTFERGEKRNSIPTLLTQARSDIIAAANFVTICLSHQEVQKPSPEGMFAQVLISLASTWAKMIKVWILT